MTAPSGVRAVAAPPPRPSSLESGPPPSHRPARSPSPPAGLQAIAQVAASIKAGYYTIGIAGGVESMTTNPMAWEGAINPRVAESQSAQDCLLPMGERRAGPICSPVLTPPPSPSSSACRSCPLGVPQRQLQGSGRVSGCLLVGRSTPCRPAVPGPRRHHQRECGGPVRRVA